MSATNTTASSTIIRTLILTGMAFFIICAHTLLRLVNDAMVVVEMGAQAIPALKLQLLLPKIAVFGLFVILYRQNRIKTFFNIAGTTFFGFFLFMALSTFFSSEQTSYGPAIVTVHYYLCHLWPLVMFSMLFWVIANQNFTTKQAAVSYPIIIAASSLAPIFISGLYVGLNDYRLYIIVLLLIAFIMALNYLLFRNSCTTNEITVEKTITFSEKVIYISLIIAIFVSADLVKHGLDLIFKETTRAMYSDAISYNNFMGTFVKTKSYIGISLTVLTCWMVWAFGWRASILIAPTITLLYMGIAWHSGINPNTYETLIPYFSGFEGASAEAFFLCQSALIFSGLSLLVTTTSQMSLIPLPGSTKARANAFLAIIISGNTLASLITVLNITLLNATELTPILKYQVLISLFVWICSAILLGKRYKALENTQTS